MGSGYPASLDDEIIGLLLTGRVAGTTLGTLTCGLASYGVGISGLSG